VAAGVVDAAWGLNGVPRGRYPRTLLMELPLVAQNSKAATETIWSMRESHLADDYKGFKVLALHCSNGNGFFMRDKKMEKIEDARGLRIRAASSQVQAMLEAIGAAPITMGPGQIYEALEKGTLDGVTMVYDGVIGFRLENLIKHHYVADLFVICFHVVMSPKKYESLPAEGRQAIDETTGDAWVRVIPGMWSKSDTSGRTVALGKGMVETPVPPESREAWRKMFQPMIDKQIAETEKQGVANARAIYEEMLKRAKQYAQ
jgi:TRAP-type C4-dicarboxylate transport system substrate-binding protein